MVKLVTLERPDIDVGIIINFVKKEQEAFKIFEKFNEIVKRFLNKEVQFRGSIIRDATVVEAIMRQVPLAVYAPKSPAMQSLIKIARNLLGIQTAKKKALTSR